MEEKLNQVKELLKKHSQEHLLTFYEDLTPENKELLLNQILDIDFELMSTLYANTKKEVEIDTDSIEPISYIDKSKLSEEDLPFHLRIHRPGADSHHTPTVRRSARANGTGMR